MPHTAPPRLRAALSHALLMVGAATMVLPFLWMLTTSLKSESEVFANHLLPSASSLGEEGAVLVTRDGQRLFLARAQKDADGLDAVDAAGQAILVRGEAIRLCRGNPDASGSKGDRARTAEADSGGENLSDDLGLPVLNSQLMRDEDKIRALGGVARFRDPRVMGKYAEPVLVPRDLDHGANEALARRWFSRYSGNWEGMLHARWGNLVPLMVSERLRDAWADMSGRPDAIAVDGVPIRDPHEGTSLTYYQYKNLSWSELGTPVRDNQRPTAIVDRRGIPVPYRPPFPVYLSDDDPLADAAGRPLLAFVGAAAAPRKVYGREIPVDRRLRLLGSNYQTVLSDPQIKMSLFAWNSVFIAVCVVALQLITSSLAAFAFARLEWPGRDRLFIAYLGTLMIPGVVTQIPNYIILQQLGWLNSFWGLIVPASASAFGTFMLRQYMLTLPRGLEEAARIDGAGTLRIWWTIILPLCKPALITLAIFTFAATWQSFTWPLIVAPAEEVRVLPVALRNFSNEQKTAYNLLMAASLVMMAPMILLFVFGQKYFIRGIQVGGIKG
jgi:ABC-type glycerol-3-phosphate transport system permease component